MTPDPVAPKNRTEGDFNVTQVWLDSLSRGTCDEDAFLQAVQMLTRRSPDAAWETLALLDQFYRRGKIQSDVFRRVKSRLGSQLLGPALDIERGVPLTRSAVADAPAPSPAIVPVAPSPAPAAPAPPSAKPAPAQVRPAPPALRMAANSVPLASVRGSNHRTVPIGIEEEYASKPDKPPDAREVGVGDVLRGRYAIKNVLGLGGTGTVFEAVDRFRLDLPDSGQRVAVKVLNARAAHPSTLLIDLRREFQLLQSLSHPNIVRAHEYDRDGDTAFFTMEYLSGLSLDSVLSAHGEVVLERAHALIIIRDVAAALEHAHSRGVVHGDLNPGNIFVTNDGSIRVLDFGAAHTPGEPAVMSADTWEATAYATPRYASCQLLNGERADARDDTYSLACVLYVLLGGKHPFGDLNAAQARAQRLKPARPAGLTGKQWQALRAGLAFDRERRPVDLGPWLEPFELPKMEARLPPLPTLLKSPPHRSGRSGLWVAILVLASAAAAGGWWASGHMDRVAQTTSELTAGARSLLAGADSFLQGLWQEARKAVAGSAASPVAPVEPPALKPAERGAAPPPADGLPATAASVESPARAARPSVPPTDSTAAAPARPPAARVAIARAAPAAPASHAAAAAQPRTRIELAADTVEVPPADPAAHLVVRRSGNLRAAAGFTWWTESGTAKPDQDFMSVKPHKEQFEPGKATTDLFVPIVTDPLRKQSKSFYIVINDPSEGVSLGKRTLTMVTISPSG